MSARHSFKIAETSKVLLLVLLSQLSLNSAFATPELAPPQTFRPGPTASITGIVRDLEDQPLPRATVWLSPARGAGAAVEAIANLPQPGLRVTTDANGRFALLDVIPGLYELITVKNGYVENRDWRSSDGTPVAEVLANAGETIELSGQLERAGIISGRIFGPLFRPLPRVRVQARQARESSEGNVVAQLVASALTDDHGYYRLFFLTPGEYVIEGRVPTQPVARTGENMAPIVGYETTFYPGVPTQAETSIVRVEAGEETTGIDFPLTFVRMDSPQSQTATPGFGTITGVVRRDATGEPVDGAVVELIPEGAVLPALRRDTTVGLVGETTRYGRFTLMGVAPGRYRLEASADGFTRQEYGQTPGRDGGAIIDLASEATVDVAIDLVPTGTISGRVFDEFGDPLPDVTIQALRSRYSPDGTLGFTRMQAGVTDDRGEFRLFGLSPEKYTVVATEPGPFAGSGYAEIPNLAPRDFLPPTFYPGVTNRSEAYTIDVAPGGLGNRFDFKISFVAAVDVHGKITTSIDGARIGSNLMVTPLANNIPGQLRRILPAADGTFQVTNLLPGPHRFIASVVTSDGRTIARSTVIEIGNRDVDEFVVTIGPGVAVPFAIEIEDGNGEIVSLGDYIANRESENVAGSSWARIRPSLRSAGGWLDGTSPTSGAFPDVAPGTYALSLSNSSPNYFVKRVEVGGQLLSTSTIEVSDGTQSINVLLSARGGKIAGTARNRLGDAVGGAHVVLVPHTQNPMVATEQPYRVAVSGDDGGFELIAIPPGEYSLYSWDYLESLDFYDPDFLARSQGRGKEIQMEELETRTIDVEVLNIR